MAPERSFPDGFLWGAATAAHQVEGGLSNNDWWRFEQEGGIRDGGSAAVACDHYNRYREDFRDLRRLRHNCHRLSIEWSRVEPSPGEFDDRELRHYRDVLSELREQGMAPMVTLHHFTSPLWFTDRGGWAAGGAADAFLPFVRRVAAELGDLVAMWCTINEPNVYAVQGWLLGEFPPARRADLRGWHRVLGNLRQAHEAAYRELKVTTPHAPVGLAFNQWLLLPAHPRKRRDRAAARTGRLLADTWPGRGGRLEKITEASADYIGLNHYSGQLAAFDPTRPGELFIRRFNPPGIPTSDFDWAIVPGWMRQVLDELKPRGLPVYITESGLATTDDELRQRFLLDVLEQVWLAITEDGVDVRGYFHWTSMDNFEWAQGYAMKFGLIEVDRATLARRPKPSAQLFARIAQSNSLPGRSD
ncbi:MAG TPA: family 1 glycosylhydrolase [Candidatus Dormibacteraeota bacterium]